MNEQGSELKRYIKKNMSDILTRIYENTVPPEEEKFVKMKYDILKDIMEICEKRGRY